ncbi:MAG: lycopene cyclase domain-containing protein, partial [Cellulomonas sp.]|nr:lycopene cyclase domain-containing protein [Cellulomonas sp.]
MTNLVLNLIVLGVLLVAALPVLRTLRPWPVIGSVAVLCALTVVFDTLMIRVGLYVFDPTKILGVRLWGAPLEDFAYAVAAGLAMPVLWTVLGR